MGLFPGYSSPIPMGAECKNAPVLRFRCMLKTQVVKINPETSDMVFLMSRNTLQLWDVKLDNYLHPGRQTYHSSLTQYLPLASQ